jgi:hypothetical protein
MFGVQQKHRVFVSYHHKDEAYRQRWDQLFGSMFTNVSVGAGEIDDSSSAEYIKRLIQTDYITQASVVVVLVGPRTYCRKHVDWEISAGLNSKVGGHSGLAGIWLPHRPDYGPGRSFDASTTPPRLVDNISSGFAHAYDWSDDAAVVSSIVERAFQARVTEASKINNGRGQMQYNICD